MKINERMDEGDILLQRELAIEPGEHAPALQDRLIDLGVELLVETMERLDKGHLVPRPQEREGATMAPLLDRADGLPAVDLGAAEIEGRVRGFDPWPGVWFGRRRKRIRLIAARALEGVIPDASPGRVVAYEDGALVVACGGGSRLAVTKIQAEGGRVIDASDALNGRLLVPGDDLESLQGRR
jgi:methionyl-tRNA formyltransferase